MDSLKSWIETPSEETHNFRAEEAISVSFNSVQVVLLLIRALLNEDLLFQAQERGFSKTCLLTPRWTFMGILWICPSARPTLERVMRKMERLC